MGTQDAQSAPITKGLGSLSSEPIQEAGLVWKMRGRVVEWCEAGRLASNASRDRRLQGVPLLLTVAYCWTSQNGVTGTNALTVG